MSTNTITNTITDTKMQNTGTWDSDLLVIFAVCFFSPIVLFFVLGIFLKIKDLLEAPSYQSVVYIPIEKEVVKVNNVYRYSQAPKAKPKRRNGNSKPKQTQPRPKKSKPEHSGMASEAVSCLISLGWKSASANRCVSNALSSKRYKTAEDIVTDLIKYRV